MNGLISKIIEFQFGQKFKIQIDDRESMKGIVFHEHSLLYTHLETQVDFVYV